MTELHIKVVGAHAVMTRKDGRLTTGMVGAVARFDFDSVWDGLTKVAVFRCGGVVRDALEWDGDSVRIPAEVLCEEGYLHVGVEGRDSDGLIVIPTTWTKAVPIESGANASGDPSTDPGLEVWAQILNMIGPLVKLGTTDKSSIVAAINEILRLVGSGGGSVDEATVERIVEEYLAENPPESGTKIHVGPEPPEDGSAYWLDTGELGEEFVPAPALPEVGKFLRVAEVDENGKVAATETVGTDTSLSVSGAPADAYVAGQNIRNIGKTLNSIEKISRFMTTSEWVLSIDSVAKTVTVPSGMLACNNWCMALAEQTVDIVQDDATTLVVYDPSAETVRSVRFTDYTGKTMYVIAVITAERYTEPNANWVQGPYLVDGVLVGASDGAPGKSAYEYAQDGGYAGTEEEFAQKLAEDQPSGADEEAWESIADISLTEAVDELSQTWVDTPMRKIRINLITVAAETATNYMSVSIATNNSGSSNLNAGCFYATPLPTTSAQNYEYFAEVFKLGDDVAVSFTESSGGIVPKGSTIKWRGIINGNTGVKSAVSLGNGLYGRALSEQITGVSIGTYGTFAEGTKMTIWGVRL